MIKDYLFNGKELTASATSTTFNLEDSPGFSINAKFSGSAVGTMSIQGALIDDPNYFEEIDTLAISGVSKYLLNYANANFDFIRVVYTHTSGTGETTMLIGRKV